MSKRSTERDDFPKSRLWNRRPVVWAALAVAMAVVWWLSNGAGGRLPPEWIFPTSMIAIGLVLLPAAWLLREWSRGVDEEWDPPGRKRVSPPPWPELRSDWKLFLGLGVFCIVLGVVHVLRSV